MSVTTATLMKPISLRALPFVTVPSFALVSAVPQSQYRPLQRTTSRHFGPRLLSAPDFSDRSRAPPTTPLHKTRARTIRKGRGVCRPNSDQTQTNVSGPGNRQASARGVIKPGHHHGVGDFICEPREKGALQKLHERTAGRCGYRPVMPQRPNCTNHHARAERPYTLLQLRLRVPTPS